MTPKQFQAAVYFIGATLILCVVGIIAITLLSDDSIPDVLQNVAVGSLTGLVGLLVTPRDGTAQDVRVVNAARDPVPVEEGYTLVDLLVLVVATAALVLLILWGVGVINITP